MSDRYLTALLATTKVMLKVLKPGAPSRRSVVFLYVAEHEPVTLEEIAKGLRIPMGTAYDDLRALGKIDANGKAGARLVMEQPGGPQHPAHRYTLSPLGKMTVDRLAFELEVAMLPEHDDAIEAYFEAKRHTRG